LPPFRDAAKRDGLDLFYVVLRPNPHTVEETAGAVRRRARTAAFAL
jgi:hypothetical protein